MVVDRLYQDASEDGVASGFSFDSEIISEALKNIYEENFNPMTDIEHRLFIEFWRKLNIATDTGFKLSEEIEEKEFLKAIRYNNGVFSAFKVHRMQNDVATLLLDSNGVRKPFKQWVKEVQPIADHQVYDWFRTEYTTAINRAHQAADWKRFERDADVLPNLEWMPSTAPEPRLLHKLFYGIVLPIDHPFWDKHRPGDSWNCQCDLEATDAEATPEDQIPDGGSPAMDGLENNPGKDGKIFSSNHPYVKHAHKGAKEAVLRILKSKLVERQMLYEKLLADPNYQAVEFNPENGGLKATHIQHNFDPKKGRYETNTQHVGFKEGHCVILELEDHTVQHKKNTEGTWDGKTFEIAGKENLNPNNIRDGLKHAAKKNAEIAVLYFENGFSKSAFESGLAKYEGLKNDPRQYKDFDEIICIEKDKIVYKKSHR